ncbi:MAG: methyltransferase regulatory domain-containing protein, partial [Holophagaceae bacterium]|nr:methyltransferase regulatory domain-containing protein [Holophagaceae bacterium]
TKMDPRYLLHEYLASYNEPILFKDFLVHLTKAGLAYLGDAGIPVMFSSIGIPKLKEFFEKNKIFEWDQQEQAADIFLARTFRSSLLVKEKRSIQIKRIPSPDSLIGLYYQARINKKLDDEGNTEFFHRQAGKLDAKDEKVRAVLDLLSDVAFMPASYSELAEKFVASSPQSKEIHFAYVIFSMLVRGTVDIFADPYTPPLRPGISPLAVIDIGAGSKITTNMIGEAVPLDLTPAQRAIVPLLKGDWDMEEVVAQMVGLYASGEINLDPAPVNSIKVRKILRSLVISTSETLKRMGLLV